MDRLVEENANVGNHMPETTCQRLPRDKSTTTLPVSNISAHLPKNTSGSIEKEKLSLELNRAEAVSSGVVNQNGKLRG